MGHDVIISYSVNDKPTADAVCAKLEERGIRCWIAPRDIFPGTDYAASIIKAIDESRVMVLIFSSHANASEHVMREAERALHNRIPIIPFRIEDVQPSPSLQDHIGPQHWLDALTPPLEAHILKLAEAITLLLGKTPPPITPSEPTTPPQPPRRPVTLSRKKIVLSVVIALVAVSAITAGYYSNNTTPAMSPSTAPAATAVASSGGFITYQNTSLGVKFTHPKNWTVGPISGNQTVGDYYAIAARRWDDNTTQMYFYRNDKATYEGSSDTATALNKVNAVIGFLKTSPSLSNFTLLQNATRVTLGGLPAYEIRFSYNLMTDARHPAMLGKEIWVTRGDGVYGIVYVGIPNYYNRSLSSADQIISSFEFT